MLFLPFPVALSQSLNPAHALRMHQNLAALHPQDVQIWPSSLGLWVARTCFHRMLRRICSSQRPGAFQGKGLGREQRTAYAKALRLEGA